MVSLISKAGVLAEILGPKAGQKVSVPFPTEETRRFSKFSQETSDVTEIFASSGNEKSFDSLLSMISSGHDQWRGWWHLCPNYRVVIASDVFV